MAFFEKKIHQSKVVKVVAVKKSIYKNKLSPETDSSTFTGRHQVTITTVPHRMLIVVLLLVFYSRFQVS
jgi:hypothetical protein